jgi:hypothetical protein
MSGTVSQCKRRFTKSPWHEHASALADWTLARLVNRRDACGAYYQDGQVTRRVTVDHALLIRHYRAEHARDICGLHTASAENLSLGGALDIDQHGDDPIRAEANRLAALHWFGQLLRRGFHPLLTESNGKGGYHLRVLLAEPIDAARLFHFLRRLTADHRQHGFARPPEQFPKQADVRPCTKGLGNWIRLPGRHHKRAFWSRVWDGREWLDGQAAIDFLLALQGDAPELVPNIPPPAPPRRCQPHVSRQRGNLSARIAAYLRRLPNGGEGSGRDDTAFHFGAFLVRDLALDDATALQWLEQWDAGNSPPKGRQRLIEILKNARAYGQRPIGCGQQSDLPRYDHHGHRILRVTAEVG